MTTNKRKSKSSTAVAAAPKVSPDTTPEKAAPPRPAVAKEVLLHEHLPPMPLVLTILFCSGALFVLGFRDMFATGKIILGDMDAAFAVSCCCWMASWPSERYSADTPLSPPTQDFTKSTQWFEESKGWKSTQGGLSAVKQMTTDANNMGGFFVRKAFGAAALTFALHKLVPMLFHPSGAQWKRGHFRPLLATSVFANISVASLYAYYLEDFAAAQADTLPKVVLGLFLVETLVMMFYLLVQRKTSRGPAVKMPRGKSEKTVTSRIAARTVLIVSGLMALVAARDLLFPGVAIPYFPRDDVYMEWTNVYFHSPPEGTVEAAEHGIDAPFYVGDKFVGQMMGLHVLVLILYKFVASCMVRYGSDGGGHHKSRMIWKVSAIGCILMLTVFRIFAAAAKSASLDLRWHLMWIGYEAMIMGLMGYA